MLSARLLKRGIEPFLDRTRVGLRFLLSDGSDIANTDNEPEATVRFHHPRAEWNAISFGHVGLLESFFRQDLDIDGDLCAVFRASYDSNFAKPNPLVTIRNRWHEWRFSNRTIEQAKENARVHYGLPREFFAYWLDDPTLTYTCAYWKEGTRTIEEAERNKLEHVCRKLRLEPGERVADIKEADHREVDEQFDKVGHVGVLEHCGRDQLRPGIEALSRATKPGGLGVLHYIGHVGHYDTEFYIRKHVFPGGWIPSLTQTLDIMEANGLEILDIENLRRHYALTLDAWAERFDAHWDEIRKIDPERFDEFFRRNWRVYLRGCAEMFRSFNGYTHLFQIVYSKGNVGYDYPMSRAYMYAPDFREAMATAEPSGAGTT